MIREEFFGVIDDAVAALEETGGSLETITNALRFVGITEEEFYTVYESLLELEKDNGEPLDGRTWLMVGMQLAVRMERTKEDR